VKHYQTRQAFTLQTDLLTQIYFLYLFKKIYLDTLMKLKINILHGEIYVEIDVKWNASILLKHISVWKFCWY